jgi:cytochrome c-type biogenesis protein
VSNLFATSFFLGVLATGSPCILPLYPAYLAFLSAQGERGLGTQRYFLGFFVLAGVLTMMLILGAVIALLSISVGSLLAWLIPLADLLILTLGILLIADRNPFAGLPRIRVPAMQHPFGTAFYYGFLYGPIALPCSGPLLVAIFALSLTATEALSKFWVFLWFGIGMGLPLLILSLLSGALQRQLTSFFARHNRAVNLVGGLLLMGVAVYDFTKNWNSIRLFFSAG